jgi:hypothetical protein
VFAKAASQRRARVYISVQIDYLSQFSCPRPKQQQQQQVTYGSVIMDEQMLLKE